MTLIVLALAWMVGIFLADALRLPLWHLVAGSVGGGIAAIVLRRHPRLRLIFLAICVAAAGGARLAAAEIPVLPHSIRLLNESGEVQIRGIVVEDPRRLADGQRVVMVADSVRVGNAWKPAEGLALVTLPRYPERFYGDRLELTGALTTPRAAA
ncbi:MAG: competence protein ComEC, partial [Roseiflexus castenholzii]